jgi:hypothetical protein
VLTKVRLNPFQIIDAFIGYNFDILTVDTCDLLNSIMPEEKEGEKYKNLQEEQIENLAMTDQFVWGMLTIAEVRNRTHSIIFYTNYEEKAESLLDEAENFDKAYEVLKTDKNFKRFLAVILLIGNYLNGTTIRGGANGFQIGLLATLSEIKSNVPSKNFTTIVIDYICNILNEKEIFDFIKNFEIFNDVSFERFETGIKEYEDDFKVVIEFKKKIMEIKEKGELEKEDKTEEFLGKFYDKAQKYLTQMKEKQENIKKQFEDTAKYFCFPTSKKITGFFAVFKKFYQTIKQEYNTFKEYDERRKKRAKK